MCAVSYLKQLKNVFCFRLPLRRRQRSRPRLQTKPTEQSAYYAHMKGIIIRFGWLHTVARQCHAAAQGVGAGDGAGVGVSRGARKLLPLC